MTGKHKPATQLYGWLPEPVHWDMPAQQAASECWRRITKCLLQAPLTGCQSALNRELFAILHHLKYNLKHPPAARANAAPSARKIKVKTTLIAIAALAFATIASAAFLDKEMSTGSGTKVCVYSDGTTITVGEFKFCPLSK